VRSHLGFDSIVWSPNYALCINQVKNLQYKFNLFIGRDPYHQQTFHLGMALCKLRRKIAYLIFLFDFLNYNIDFTELLSMVGFSFTNHSKRSNNLFFVSFYNNNYSSA